MLEKNIQLIIWLFIYLFHFLPTKPSSDLIPKLKEKVKDSVWNFRSPGFQLMLDFWVCWALYQFEVEEPPPPPHPLPPHSLK